MRDRSSANKISYDLLYGIFNDLYVFNNLS